MSAMLGNFCLSMGHLTVNFRMLFTIENFRTNIDRLFSAQVLEENVLPDPLDPRRVPTDFKIEEKNTVVVYNPEVSSLLDAELMNTLYLDR